MSACERTGARLPWAGAAALALAACRSPAEHRESADRAAYRIIADAQRAELGAAQSFTIEPPAETLRRRLLLEQALPVADRASLGSRDVEPIEQWPDDEYFRTRAPAGEQSPPVEETLLLSLLDVLEIGARNSREYRTEKENVFRAALALDLEQDRFRNTWAGLLSSGLERDLGADPPTTASVSTAALGWSKRFLNGAMMSVNLAVDLVKLLTQGKDGSFGVLGDATIAIPLLRGSGEFVVGEPMRQAERDVVYAIYFFERFKRAFAVDLASQYYGVLQLAHESDNELENYRWLIDATRRARRMAEGRRMDEIEVDQTAQDELEARDNWIQALRAHQEALDRFKQVLGLPVDARIGLDPIELDRLSLSTDFQPLPTTEEHVPADAPIEVQPPGKTGAGPFEIEEQDAIRLALDHRLDLRVAIGRVFDAQRVVAVAADDLRADLTLLGNASYIDRREASDAALPSANLRPERGTYSVFAFLDLPFERTAERNVFRNTEIDFEASVRAAQAVEDQVKLEVRSDLRALLEARERVRIQQRSLDLAQRRVDITSRFLQADRAEARDVLEAQSDLTEARNLLSAERVRYRIAELALQRDLDLLQIDENGLWMELDPAQLASP